MERDCESELSKLNIEQNACIYQQYFALTFEVLDTRDGRKSTVVISQFPVSTWFDMFADNTYADACLTRITDKHHTYRLEMNGINMRETE